MQFWIQDIKYAIRSLVKQPGFSLLAVLTLGLSIGANSAVFSVVNAVVLQPLPFPDSGRLAILFEGLPKSDLPIMMFSAADLRDYRQQQQSFESLAAYQDTEFELSGMEQPEKVKAARVSASLFPLLGVDAALGRTFLEAEDQEGRNQFAIISHSLWQRHYDGDQAVLEKAIQLDRQPYTIVGVMPAGFEFPLQGPRWNNQPADVWVPMAFTESELRVRGGGYNKSVIGRLAPGVTIEQAHQEANAIAKRIHDEIYPASLRNAPNFDLTATVIPFHEEVVGQVRAPLLLLLGAVLLVLLVACADVANLLMSRAARREREIAVRLTLGAGRGRLLRMLVSESLLVALASGLVGVLISLAGTRLLLSLQPGDLPRMSEIGLDWPLLGFTLLLCGLTVLIFGLAPALGTLHPNLHESLKERSGSVQLPVAGRHLLQKVMVVSTIALSIVLLIGAGLLMRSFVGLLSIDPGFRPQSVLTLNVPLSLRAYPQAENIRAFYQDLMQGIESLPGAEVVGASSDLPFRSTEARSFWPEERPAAAADAPHSATHSWVMGRYFEAQGIPLRSGRYFTGQDRLGSPGVVILSQSLAESLWPGEDPIGKRIKWGVESTGTPWMDVVGVVADVKDGGIRDEASPHTYEPYLQMRDAYLEHPNFVALRSLNFAIRTQVEPTSIAAAVRNEVRKRDPQLAITGVETMQARLSDALAPQRFLLQLVSLFAAGALFLAALGLYGVLSYSVTQRTREMGIRMALGARGQDLLAMVLKQGMLLTLLGIVVGLAVALAGGQILTSQLYGVTSSDPLTFLGVSALLLLVTLLACYFPARRATRVDALISLNAE